MRVEWFENPDNVAYVDIDEFADHFANELGLVDLRKKIEDFRDNPAWRTVFIGRSKLKEDCYEKNF